MVGEVQQEVIRRIIPDTSFIINYSQGQYWTLEPFNAIRQPNSTIVIPRGVGDEYDRFMTQKRLGPDKHNGYDEIEKLFNLTQFTIYRDSLRQTLSEKLDQEIEYLGHRQRSLSRTDKTIVQAAYDYAKSGLTVAVVSSDRGIIDQVGNICDEENLDIERFSPWRIPVAQPNIDHLVSGNVGEDLAKAHAIQRTTAKYLAIAKSMHLGVGVYYDIVFGIYVDAGSSLKLPQIDGAYFVRLFSISQNNHHLGLLDNYFRWLSCRTFAAYLETDPTVIVLFTNNRPLSLLEKKTLMCRFKNRQLTENELRRVTSARPKETKSARIEDEDIARHDKLTVGKLNSFRQKLKRLKKF